jgi:hypothetical protein
MVLDTYGHLEVLGHVEFFGHLSEEEIAGVKFIRVDVLKDGERVETKYFGTASIYAITPMDEQAVIEATRTPVRRLPWAPYERADDEFDDGPNL